MPQRLTCPHCEVALGVADNAGAAVIMCPNCGGEIPHPTATPESSGSVMATVAQHEAMGQDRPISGWDTLLLGLLAAIIGFLVGTLLSPTTLGGARENAINSLIYGVLIGTVNTVASLAAWPLWRRLDAFKSVSSPTLLRILVMLAAAVSGFMIIALFLAGIVVAGMLLR
jgi:hypothetical protein